MQARLKTILAIGLTAILAAFSAESALAKHKKRHPAHSGVSIERDYDGTPIIMQGYRPRRPAAAESQRANPSVHIPRGSSSFVDIPPPVPSPYSSNSPPARALVQPTVQPYNPPPITTFSDRVTNAIHAYPLEKGIGNNPTDQQMFIRQRANQ